MNRLRILILSVLKREHAVDGVTAMSAYEIEMSMECAYKADSIYRNLVVLKNYGYINAGYKDGKANTYYITQKGLEALEDARKAG